MPEPSDIDLLASWSKSQSETGFRTLVDRYAGLVYMAAKRTCADEAMAREASQLTFITLARKAASLTNRDSLGSWLHVTAMMQAKNLLQLQRREALKRERLGTHLETMSSDQPSTLWKELEPVLDDALASLSEPDREAIILRHYRSLSVREVAASLAISVDATQKRLDRALERLRHQLDRRGYATGSSLASALLTGLASDARAGEALASSFASRALTAGPATGLSALATYLLSLLTRKPAIVALALCILGAFALKQSYRDHSAHPAAGARPVPDSPFAGSMNPAPVPVRLTAIAVEENRRMVEKYGEDRTRLSRSVIERTIEVATYVDSLLGHFLSITEQAGTMPETMKLDRSLNLTADQRRKLSALSIDFVRRKMPAKREALERIRNNPLPVMEMLLAGDACTRGESTLEKYEDLRNAAGLDLKVLENPIDIDRPTLQFEEELPFDDETFMNGLRECLNAAQLETFIHSIKDGLSARIEAAEKRRKFANFSTMPPIGLTQLDKQVEGTLKILEGLNDKYQRMLEAFIEQGEASASSVK
jgi:RNA polymerase sigma factor (sigma-70 family)